MKTCLECDSVEGTPHHPQCILGQRAEREKRIQQARDLVARKSMRGIDTFKVFEALLAEVDELTDAMTEVPKPIPAEETANAIALLARQLDPTSVLFTAKAEDQLTEEQFANRIGEMLQGWGYADQSPGRAQIEAQLEEVRKAYKEVTRPQTRAELLKARDLAAEEQGLALKEAVDGPEHYGGKGDPYEAIVVMLEWFGPDDTAAFCRLNAVKYLQRAGVKVADHEDEIDATARDLKKAAWYCTTAARILETGRAR